MLLDTSPPIPATGTSTTSIAAVLFLETPARHISLLLDTVSTFLTATARHTNSLSSCQISMLLDTSPPIPAAAERHAPWVPRSPCPSVYCVGYDFSIRRLARTVERNRPFILNEVRPLEHETWPKVISPCGVGRDPVGLELPSRRISLLLDTLSTCLAPTARHTNSLPSCQIPMLLDTSPPVPAAAARHAPWVTRSLCSSC